MADYDVGVLGLTSPPSLAVLQTYRPAVSVRNNGIHDALASGVLRIYSAGLLVFTTEIYSAVIPPGETRDANAVGYWTPTEGTYLIIADVSCPLDQLESNNHLSPTQVVVSGAAPPPPPGVALHAAQHEEGMADELIVDGLHGRLAEAQTPLAHKESHQVGGSDLLNVDGLPGTLAEGQPIADHHESHEDGGGDELNVDSLRGVLLYNQPAMVHDNAKHDPNYTTVTEFGNHLADTTDVHEVATNLEHVVHKGEPDGYPELDEYGHVPPPRLGTWTTPPPANDKALTPAGIWDYPFPAEHTADEHDDTVEATANKGEPDGYPELDEFGHVPPPQLGLWTTPPPAGDKALTPAGVWDYPTPKAHAPSHELGGSDPLDISGDFLSAKSAAISRNGTQAPTDYALLHVTTPFLHNSQSIRFTLHFSLVAAPGESGAYGFWFDIAGVLMGQIAESMASDTIYTMELEGIIHACSATQYAGSLQLLCLCVNPEGPATTFFRSSTVAPFAIPTSDTWIKVVGDLNGLAETHLDLSSSFTRTELPASA